MHGSAVRNTRVSCAACTSGSPSPFSGDAAQMPPAEDCSQKAVRSKTVTATIAAANRAMAGNALQDAKRQAVLAAREACNRSANRSTNEGRACDDRVLPMFQALCDRSVIATMSDLPRQYETMAMSTNIAATIGFRAAAASHGW